jgi:hypothetical protein
MFARSAKAVEQDVHIIEVGDVLEQQFHVDGLGSHWYLVESIEQHPGAGTYYVMRPLGPGAEPASYTNEFSLEYVARTTWVFIDSVNE